MSDREEFENVMYSRGRTDIDLRTDAYSADSDYVIPSVQECWEVWKAARESEGGEALGFPTALKISKAVFSAYREDFPKWGGKLDGTPAQNDLPVRVAKAFQGFYPQSQSAPAPNGWQLVPINPTGEMMGALKHHIDSYYNGELLERYREMLDAAPTPPEQESE